MTRFGSAIRSGDSLGAATHGEDPAKPGYTSGGSSVAENSQFAWGCGSLDLEAQINQWIAGPFHEHCAFDSHSYLNPDRDAQEYGRWTLRSSGAVVLIPREPLIRGAQYSVSITVQGHTYAWTFRIAG
ncbi:MAG: hypothetical protein IVW56_00775 [Candidatus Binataceae bacterium]|nr:hypothetical protein [Candidatus Binataceae bacterium]